MANDHHGHHGHGAPIDYAADKRAAYTGLVLAAIFLFTTVVTIVKLTNAKYAHEGAEKPAATAAP